MPAEVRPTKRTLLAAILVAVLGVLAACGGDAEDEPRLLVVVAASLSQANCQVTPIQVFEYPSGYSQTGPSAYYLNLALSPSGDRVAAAQDGRGLCISEDNGSTNTLTVLDTANLSVSKTILDIPLPVTIDWSPSGEFVLVTGFDRAAVYDVRAEVPLVWDVLLRRGESAPKRTQIAWPSTGKWLVMFSVGKDMLGLPRNPDSDIQRWTFQCPEKTVRGLISVEAAVTGESVAVIINCWDSDLGYFSADLSTLDGSMGELVFRGPPPPQGFSVVEFEALRDAYAGAATRFHDNGVADRDLAFVSVLYSPTVDVVGYLREEGQLPPDVEAIIAVKPLGQEILYVPLTLAGDPGGWIDSNLLHDVVELD